MRPFSILGKKPAVWNRDQDIYAGFWNSFHLSDQKEQHIESWVNCFGGFYCWLLPKTLLRIVRVNVRAVTFLLQDFDRACECSDKTAALHIFKHLLLSHIAMHCISSNILSFLKHNTGQNIKHTCCLYNHPPIQHLSWTTFLYMKKFKCQMTF